MNKTLKNGLIALMLTIVTMFVFFVFKTSDSTETILPSDAIVQFSFGWPLEAGKGSSGGDGGELSEITYNKLNLALDFSLFLFIYFALLNFRYTAKKQPKKKKKR